MALKKNFWIKASVGALVLVGGIVLTNKIIKKRKDENGDDSGETTTSGSNSSNQGRRYVYVGSEGYLTVRTEPVVNNGWVNNIIFKLYGTGKILGLIISETKGEDGWTWYQVKWNTPESGRTKGWVRQDVAVVKQH